MPSLLASTSAYKYPSFQCVWLPGMLWSVERSLQGPVSLPAAVYWSTALVSSRHAHLLTECVLSQCDGYNTDWQRNTAVATSDAITSRVAKALWTTRAEQVCIKVVKLLTWSHLRWLVVVSLPQVAVCGVLTSGGCLWCPHLRSLVVVSSPQVAGCVVLTSSGWFGVPHYPTTSHGSRGPSLSSHLEHYLFTCFCASFPEVILELTLHIFCGCKFLLVSNYTEILSLGKKMYGGYNWAQWAPRWWVWAGSP